jgi:alpha-galactosidase
LPIEAGLDPLQFACRGIALSDIQPLIDGEVPAHAPPRVDDCTVVWELAQGRALLEVEAGEVVRLRFRLEGLADDRALDSLGLRFGRVEGVRLYLRNGYQSWDGSFFVEPGTPPGEGPPARAPTLGFAMTALLPVADKGALIVGFARHDRFQSRFRFGGSAAAPTLDVETLWDRVPQSGRLEAEPLVLRDDAEVEAALRTWSRLAAAESPLPPRIPKRRITGWCSWYSLYAAIDEPSILEHLAAAVRFRNERAVPLDVFQIDDGFAPEMGDWLEVRPQFPRGMKPLIDDIAAAGFTPGLWIAPFLVGNRSRLYADHPDWVVQSVAGGPLVHMKFYGEFRWHKRSEEYYVLDVTHPDAAAYIRKVFRTWRSWGVGYFKTDFMNAGMEYGPDQARWHAPDLSRVAIWRRMATIIREEIGDALWLGCGCPLWASVGLIDAARIGRDIGVSWHGDYSADSLLRDQLTRNHASGILWQADPDCVLLRDRFHDLSDEEVRSLLLFAGLAGGVLMTSDKLDEIPADRAELFAALLSQGALECEFPELGNSMTGLIVQRSTGEQGAALCNLFNPSERLIEHRDAEHCIAVPPHGSVLLGNLRASPTSASGA